MWKTFVFFVPIKIGNKHHILLSKWIFVSVIRHYVMELKRYLRHKCFSSSVDNSNKMIFWFAIVCLLICWFVCVRVVLFVLSLSLVCVSVLLCMIIEDDDRTLVPRNGRELLTDCSNGFKLTYWSGQLINNLPNDNVHLREDTQNYMSLFLSYFIFQRKIDKLQNIHVWTASMLRTTSNTNENWYFCRKSQNFRITFI